MSTKTNDFSLRLANEVQISGMARTLRHAIIKEALSASPFGLPIA